VFMLMRRIIVLLIEEYNRVYVSETCNCVAEGYNYVCVNE
jgi:hypothetical protein